MQKNCEMIEALVITNMYPNAERPAFGSFVRDQVELIREEKEIQLELFSFQASHHSSAYIQAARRLKKRFGTKRFDIVHAHFGLTLWPAFAVRATKRFITLHGTDLHHRRSRYITLAGLPWANVIAVPSTPFSHALPKRFQKNVQLLPCGVNTDRFQPTNRFKARQSLGLDPDKPYVFFPFAPDRPEKRFDLAQQATDNLGVQLLYAGNIPPEQMPLYINAANVVVCPSERESFGLSVLEALACHVPVIATPVGIHPEAMMNIESTLCTPWDLDRWQSFINTCIHMKDPRISSEQHIQRFSAQTCAKSVTHAWKTALASA